MIDSPILKNTGTPQDRLHQEDSFQHETEIPSQSGCHRKFRLDPMQYSHGYKVHQPIKQDFSRYLSESLFLEVPFAQKQDFRDGLPAPFLWQSGCCISHENTALALPQRRQILPMEGGCLFSEI